MNLKRGIIGAFGGAGAGYAEGKQFEAGLGIRSNLDTIAAMRADQLARLKNQWAMEKGELTHERQLDRDRSLFGQTIARDQAGREFQAGQKELDRAHERTKDPAPNYTSFTDKDGVEWRINLATGERIELGPGLHAPGGVRAKQMVEGEDVSTTEMKRVQDMMRNSRGDLSVEEWAEKITPQDLSLINRALVSLGEDPIVFEKVKGDPNILGKAWRFVFGTGDTTIIPQTTEPQEQPPPGMGESPAIDPSDPRAWLRDTSGEIPKPGPRVPEAEEKPPDRSILGQLGQPPEKEARDVISAELSIRLMTVYGIDIQDLHSQGPERMAEIIKQKGEQYNIDPDIIEKDIKEIYQASAHRQEL